MIAERSFINGDRDILNRAIVEFESGEAYLSYVKRQITMSRNFPLYLLDYVDLQIWLLTDAETYGMANRKHADFFGHLKQDFLNASIDILHGTKLSQHLISLNRKVFQHGHSVYTQEYLKNARGESRRLEITLTPHLNYCGEVVFVIGSAQDITVHHNIGRKELIGCI